MSEQQRENIKNNSKPNSPLSLRRAQFSLPSIVIHQETPTGSRGSVNSWKELLNSSPIGSHY